MNTEAEPAINRLTEADRRTMFLAVAETLANWSLSRTVTASILGPGVPELERIARLSIGYSDAPRESEMAEISATVLRLVACMNNCLDGRLEV
jgi:hypothetical protein